MAQLTNWSIGELLDLDSEELVYWIDQAVEYQKALNKAAEPKK